MESKQGLSQPVSGMGFPVIRNKPGQGPALRVRKMQQQSLPQGMESQPLTDKQMNAYSKESILKPVLAPPVNRLVPVPPPRNFPLEETKNEVQTADMKKQGSQRQVNDTPQSTSSKMTQESDDYHNGRISGDHALQRSLSTSQMSFERPQSAAT